MKPGLPGALPLRDEELTLERMADRILHDGRPVVLQTGPGPETDLLAAALARQLARGADVVRMTARRMDAGEFCGRLLDRLGEPPSANPAAQLRETLRARARCGRPLVVLLRGADDLPGETLRDLGLLASQSERGLRLGLVVEVEALAPAPRLDPSLGLETVTIALDEGRSRALVGLQEPSRRRRSGHTRSGRGSRSASRAKAVLLTGSLAAASMLLAGAHRLEVDANALLEGGGVALAGLLADAWEPLGPSLAGPGSPAPADPETARRAAAVPADAPRFRPDRSMAPGLVDGTEPGVPAVSAEPAAVASGPPAPLPALPSAPPGPASRPPPVAAEPPAAAPSPDPGPPPEPLTRLNVNADPWARVAVDGRDLGPTPIGDWPVAPGRHRVRAVLPDGRALERSVDVGAADVHLSFP